jgi:hypothetical protein
MGAAGPTTLATKLRGTSRSSRPVRIPSLQRLRRGGRGHGLTRGVAGGSCRSSRRWLSEPRSLGFDKDRFGITALERQVYGAFAGWAGSMNGVSRNGCHVTRLQGKDLVFGFQH